MSQPLAHSISEIRMKKTLALVGLVAAMSMGTAFAQDAGTLDSSTINMTPPLNTMENVKNFPKDPESVGKLLAVYIGGLAPALEFCGWEPDRVQKVAYKATRLVNITYGSLPPTHQLDFANGYFLAEEAHVDYLNQLKPEDRDSMCKRLDKEEKEIHAALDYRLKGLESMVVKGVMKEADLYEGRMKTIKPIQ